MAASVFTEVATAQQAGATITFRVVRDEAGSTPVPGVLLRTADLVLATDQGGIATADLGAGVHTLIASRIGYAPDTIRFTVRAGVDAEVVIVLVQQMVELEGLVVEATRGSRRVENSPLRVEVIDEEEIAEKIAMSPGDIAMMLAETGGLRVQVSNPALGGANVRIQGLRGRYSLILADGLPLYGQAGGLGLLQIPPVDLGRVEVIKGSASALYGSAALGGVINLVARRPEHEPSNSLLLNQTSRGGSDGVYFRSAPITDAWGYTLLAGAHGQRSRDHDDDGWADMPGYERAVVRPRLYFDNGEGSTAFLTGGYTRERRRGGTIGDAVAPGGFPHAERLRTERADAGGLVRRLLPGEGWLGGSLLAVRGSAMEQLHEHRLGPVYESDRHRTWFTEAALTIPVVHAGRTYTYVVGGAFQQDAYRQDQLGHFNFTHNVPALFAQVDTDLAWWLAVSGSARLDRHSEYGSFVNPRVSVLVRLGSDGALADWTTRFSAGTGAYAPSPFTEETEATGLAPLDPLFGDLRAERATTVSIDVGGPMETELGSVELNATGFASGVRHPLQVRETAGSGIDGQLRLEIVNAAGPTRTWGGELLARLVRELGEEGDDGEEPPAFRLTASYTFLRSTECDPHIGAGICARREVPLTPRHALGLVASVEEEGRSRVGLELYYTGRQSLEDNPYRSVSRPYLILGILGERAFETRRGTYRLFLNLENLTNVRQTRYDPLVRPSRGPGGRWTTDAWTELTGFTVNGGVRIGF